MSVLLLPERVVDLLLDAAVVLPELLFLLFGEKPERYAHHALGKFHVEPVLPVLRACRHLEIELTHARSIVADFGLVPGHRSRPEIREHPETVHAVRPGWEVIDRIALGFHAQLQRLYLRLVLAVLCDR